MFEEKSIGGIIRDAEQNYKHGHVRLGQYVQWSMHETIETITAYLNSKHISGDRDSIGREKPFFNIVTSAVNIWYRATDLDRKDMNILPTKVSDTAATFVTTVLLQQWMKDVRFGTFLNQWGRTLSQYGSAVVKFVEKKGELHATVVPWRRMIVDPVDFDALPRIERFYKTPDQLQDMGYDQDQVDKLIALVKETRKTVDNQQIDNQDEFIEIYEVHGKLPVALLKEKEEVQEEDWKKFTQQMHVISYVQSGDEFTDFTLFKGRESKDPYVLTHLIEEEGRTMSIGAVEHLFNAQWMQNHTMKNMKDQLDLVSRIIFQTSDARFTGRNVLRNIETGQIMVHKVNEPLTQLNNSSHDVSSMIAFMGQWKELEREVTSTPDASRGVIPPSGTPLGTTEIVTAQGLSLFELMVENKGLHIEDMFRRFVIPHLKKKMNTSDEIAAILEEHQIEQLDRLYIPRQAIRKFNKRVTEEILQGNIPSPFEQDVEEDNIRKELAMLGNQRFFKPSDIKTATWRKMLDKLEWKLDFAVTNEMQDKRVMLQTISAMLQTIATNPAVLQDPNAKLLFNKALSITGTISPIQLQSPSTTQVGQPVQGGAPLQELAKQQ